MREQLIQYVELLFAGAPDSTEIKQEILQNTLDRYDDLIGQGKQPEAAYRLAIAGIGDINEILGGESTGPAQPTQQFDPGKRVKPEYCSTPLWKKLLRAVGIFLYIICPIPLLVLGDIGMETIGLCGTVGIVAVATAMMVIAGGNGGRTTGKKEGAEALTPRQELRKAVKAIITTIGLVAYFAVSFLTNAWYITWLIFPIMAATQGLVTACMDLKEASKYEN